MSALSSTVGWAIVAAVLLAACRGPARPTERCRNLVHNPTWENHGSGWNLPPFAALEEGPVRSMVIQGHAEGAISQIIPKPDPGAALIAVGYARVETPHAPPATDDDITPQLWSGAVALVNGYNKRFGGFENPYTQLRFTGREVTSGCWKRFVTAPIVPKRPIFLYPHFAFWGAKFADGVKLRVAALALVAATPDTDDDPESWANCPSLPAPAPVLVSVTRRQAAQDREPDGAFDGNFTVREQPVTGEPGSQELLLAARYRQGPQLADRFIVSVTEDGSDPRLSPTSIIKTVLARRDVDQWQTEVRIRKSARKVRIAVAAAALTASGIRAQTPVLPAPWQ